MEEEHEKEKDVVAMMNIIDAYKKNRLTRGIIEKEVRELIKDYAQQSKECVSDLSEVALIGELESRGYAVVKEGEHFE